MALNPSAGPDGNASAQRARKRRAAGIACDRAGFLAAHPDVRLEIVAEESFVDVLAAGCDAGIRYDERLEQDMIAVPIGPRVQRLAVAAAPVYLDRCGVQIIRATCSTTPACSDSSRAAR